jgi:hypothetical protein
LNTRLSILQVAVDDDSTAAIASTSIALPTSLVMISGLNNGYQPQRPVTQSIAACTVEMNVRIT